MHRKGRDVPAEGFLDRYDVGPGSYQKPSMWGKQRPACVAFHTSAAQRVFPASVTNTPGPGSFEITSSKGKSVGSPFKSKTSRFHKKQVSLGPGPGGYDVLRANKKILHKTRAKSRGRRKHYRTIMPAIPSIPSSSQKFGYEETKDGELVPLTESLGRENDSRRRRRRPRKSPVRAVSFGLSKTKRFARPHGTQHMPGPGSYNTNLATKPKLLLGKASAAFESRSKRTDLIRSKDTTPAVGTYNITKRIGCTRKPSKHQFFGTTQERFGGEDTRRVYSQHTKGNSSPIRSDFDFRRTNVTRAAFGSTASQRQQLVSSKVSPGYIMPKGFAQEKRVRSMNVMCPFGMYI